MALKIIGAGLGRTGIASLKVALEHLGFGPCYHMGEVLPHVEERVPLWIAAGQGKPDWNTIFADYQSAVDYPACSFWREQMAHYPDAQVILTTRSAESWFDSVHKTIMAPDTTEWLENGPLREFLELCMWKDYKAHINDRDWMIDYFNRRNEEIVAAVPPEKLLVFEVKQGWSPLCEFLGVGVPDTEFPRVNSREETRAMLDAMIAVQDESKMHETLAEQAPNLFKSKME